MKTGGQTIYDDKFSRIDLHSLNLCQGMLFEFMNYSLHPYVQNLSLADQIEIINILEQLADQVKRLRTHSDHLRQQTRNYRKPH